MISRLSLSLMAIAACGDNHVATPDAAPDAEIVGQGSQASADFIINEVSPRGAGADWIELLNRSQAAVDLCDYFVTDSLDRLDHYLPLGGAAIPDPCEPDLLPAGAYALIIADDDMASGADHAPFRLGDADEVHIVDMSGRAIDSLVYLYGTAIDAGSLARLPSGEGLFFPAAPTPGEANR